jgi:SAM-dependent methyltransferase
VAGTRGTRGRSGKDANAKWAPGRDWTPGYFGAAYLAAYYQDPLTKEQVDGIERLLEVRPGTAMLDLCCGYGRHSLELARRGHEVTGFDLSAVLLARARREAAREGLRVRFVRGDMRALPFVSEFDVVVSLFTSFGYFDDRADDVKVLEGVARALRPGGRLLMDLLNKEWLMRHFEPRFWDETPAGPALNDLVFDFVTGRLRNRRTLIPARGRPRRLVSSIRIYTLAEMVHLLKEAGLAFTAAHGGFGGEPYGMDTFRMIVLADKRRLTG